MVNMISGPWHRRHMKNVLGPPRSLGWRVRPLNTTAMYLRTLCCLRPYGAQAAKSMYGPPPRGHPARPHPTPPLARAKKEMPPLTSGAGP